MKPILVIFSLFLFSLTSFSQEEQHPLFQTCKNQAGSDAVYLKDFIVKFPAVKGQQTLPVAKNSVILSKNIMYRFTICSSETLEGKAVLQLWDDKRMLITNLVSGKLYPSLDFMCQKTGRYHVLISFKDGKAGEAVAIMSYIKN